MPETGARSWTEIGKNLLSRCNLFPRKPADIRQEEANWQSPTTLGLRTNEKSGIPVGGLQGKT